MATYADAGLEPSIAEMIADPVVQAVMRRDGVTEPMLRACLDRTSFRHQGDALIGEMHPGVGAGRERADDAAIDHE